jgi:hypothetical protein
VAVKIAEVRQPGIDNAVQRDTALRMRDVAAQCQRCGRAQAQGKLFHCSSPDFIF